MLPKGLLKEHSRIIEMMLRLMDMAMVAIAGWLAFVIKFESVFFSRPYLLAVLLGVLLTPAVFYFFNIYTPMRNKGFISHTMDLTQAIIVLALLLAGLAFFTKVGEIYSRSWFACWMLFILIGLVTFRCYLMLLLRVMRSQGWNERRVVIFGAGELGVKLVATLQQAMWTGYRIVALLDDQAEQKPKDIHGIPVIQTPAQLSAYLTQHEIDEIWLTLPLRAEERVKQVLYELRHHTINTRFVLDIFGMDLLNHSIADVAGFPVLNLRSSPMTGINRLLKALEDRLLALSILVLISPLLFLIALGIKLSSPGPIFFRQRRLGWDGKVIKVYKFRTMINHQEADDHVTQAKLDDPRVTKFGKLLRRTSLDELPQFINVLQGRMSIVGPRPHALAHNELYKESVHIYMQRHRVKPGITGWAQVNGWRGETDTLTKMQKRVEYDLYYINNWSLSFDFKIILLTLFRGFLHRNAY